MEHGQVTDLKLTLSRKDKEEITKKSRDGKVDPIVMNTVYSDKDMVSDDDENDDDTDREDSP